VYRFVDHTAELEVELEAESAEGVLGEALRAFSELAGTADGEPIERRLEIEAGDLPALLAAWLEELVFLAETEGFIADAAELVHWSTNRVEARVRGRIGEPRPLVKAVTYHGLEFEAAGNGWRAKVVLDV
jgi:SHS2 domain-containing protein